MWYKKKLSKKGHKKMAYFHYTTYLYPPKQSFALAIANAGKLQNVNPILRRL